MRVRLLLLRAAKRGADARTVGGGAYVAALDGEVRVFCFLAVACGVVGEERGAQIALEHNCTAKWFQLFPRRRCNRWVPGAYRSFQPMRRRSSGCCRWRLVRVA